MGGVTAQSSGNRATSVGHLSHVGLQLFFERGFDETTVDDIAAAAGIGRRTFFRYFGSKNDLPWGDFGALVSAMRDYLDAQDESRPPLEVLREATLAFNRFPPEEVGYHRQRMQLLLNVPSLVAHSTLRYAAWRGVVAEYAARRMGLPVDHLRPQVIGWMFLSAALASYERWLADETSDLPELIESALDELGAVFGTREDEALLALSAHPGGA